MRISDILRKMADVVDQAEGGEQVQPAIAQEPVAQEPVAEPVVQATAIQGELEAPCDAAETPAGGELDAETATMVSPLQQEHELLKKSQGVNNNVSEFAGDEQDENGFQNELASMKQAAGIGEEQQGPHDYAQDLKPVSINPRAVAATEANNKQDPRLKQTQRKDR